MTLYPEFSSKLPKPEVEKPREEGGPTGLSSLGNKVTVFLGHLESFPAPKGISHVSLECTEVTGFCPVTSQPDFYTITISYQPNLSCIESKSLKLYLQDFRDKGIFCEALSVEIADKILEDIKPKYVSVTVKQTPRGGIGITAYTDKYPKQEETPNVQDR